MDHHALALVRNFTPDQEYFIERSMREKLYADETGLTLSQVGLVVYYCQCWTRKNVYASEGEAALKAVGIAEARIFQFLLWLHGVVIEVINAEGEGRAPDRERIVWTNTTHASTPPPATPTQYQQTKELLTAMGFTLFEGRSEGFPHALTIDLSDPFLRVKDGSLNIHNATDAQFLQWRFTNNGIFAELKVDP